MCTVVGVAYVIVAAVSMSLRQAYQAAPRGTVERVQHDQLAIALSFFR